MKKLLQLSLLFVGISSFAQGTCATATPITANAIVTCPPMTGAYAGTCLPSTTGQAGANPTPKSMWFTYTATANGEVTVSSDLSQNDGITNSNDTRLSILTSTGPCAGLACYYSSDDVNPEATPPNYKSAVTFPVQSGTIYYFLWDSGWDASNKGFDFSFNFNGLVCVRPSLFEIYPPANITKTAAVIGWDPAIGSPANYQVEYGTAGFTQGQGTLSSPIAAGTAATNFITTYSISSPSTPSGDLEFYYRSVCSPLSSSAWVGPFPIALAQTCPYANDFDATSHPTSEDGFTLSGWNVIDLANFAQSGTMLTYSNSRTTAATNAYMFTRALALQANETVTLTFYTRLDVAAASQTLKVLVNNGLLTTGATQLGADITVSGTTYTLQTRTFTAQTAGTYYFIFNNATPIVSTASSLLLDTVNATSNLKVNDFLTSKFSVYPNPVNNVINFSNDANAVVSTIDMTDLNGRVIKSVKTNATEGQISVSDLATGIYMMRITTDQGMAVKKIVKE